MNPGGARRGRGRGCKPVGPSIHSLRILATFYQGIQSQNISIHGGMAARGTTLPPFVHHSLLLLFASSCTTRVCHMARTFHPLSRKGIRANDHRDTNQGEARDRSFSSSSSSFSSSSSSFEASIRTTLVMILESHVFPFKFKVHFYFFCRMERRVVSFFLYLFLQRYRGSRVTKK